MPHNSHIFRSDGIERKLFGEALQLFLVHTAHDRFNIAEFKTRLISAIACVNANSSAAATLFWHAKMLGLYLSAFVLQVFLSPSSPRVGQLSASKFSTV